MLTTAESTRDLKERVVDDDIAVGPGGRQPDLAKLNLNFEVHGLSCGPAVTRWIRSSRTLPGDSKHNESMYQQCEKHPQTQKSHGDQCFEGVNPAGI